MYFFFVLFFAVVGCSSGSSNESESPTVTPTTVTPSTTTGSGDANALKPEDLHTRPYPDFMAAALASIPDDVEGIDFIRVVGLHLRPGVIVHDDDPDEGDPGDELWSFSMQERVPAGTSPIRAWRAVFSQRGRGKFPRLNELPESERQLIAGSGGPFAPDAIPEMATILAAYAASEGCPSLDTRETRIDISIPSANSGLYVQINASCSSEGKYQSPQAVSACWVMRSREQLGP